MRTGKDYFHYAEVEGIQQSLWDKYTIIQGSSGKLNFIYYIWAFGLGSVLITLLGMIPYFVELSRAPQTKKRKYYFIISNLSLVFATSGLISILYGEHYLPFAIQKIYEAIALNALRKLMLGYLGNEKRLVRYGADQGKQNYWRVPPCCCFIPPCLLRDSEFSNTDARLLALFTRQFIIISPLISVVMLFFAYIYTFIVGKTEKAEMQISYALQLCRLLVTISTLFALYGVFVGWKLTRSLTQFNITKKFALFKVFILLSLTQEYAVQIMIDKGLFAVGNTLYPSPQMSMVVLGVLLCIEGPLIMLFLRCTNAFSPKDLHPSQKFSLPQAKAHLFGQSLDSEEKEAGMDVNVDVEQQKASIRD